MQVLIIACRIWFLDQGSDLGLLYIGGGSLSHWTIGEILGLPFNQYTTLPAFHEGYKGIFLKQDSKIANHNRKDL